MLQSRGHAATISICRRLQLSCCVALGTMSDSDITACAASKSLATCRTRVAHKSRAQDPHAEAASRFGTLEDLLPSKACPLLRPSASGSSDDVVPLPRRSAKLHTIQRAMASRLQALGPEHPLARAAATSPLAAMQLTAVPPTMAGVTNGTKITDPPAHPWAW